MGRRKSPHITANQIHEHMKKSFKDAEHPIVAAPYNDHVFWCRIRRLRMAEIKTCGDFSLIETFQDKLMKEKTKELTFHQMSEYAELQHKVVDMAMVQPTYTDMMTIITDGLDYDQKSVEKKMDHIKTLFHELSISADINDKKKAKDLQEEYAQLEMQYKFVLAPDFLGFVFNYALSVDISDIKLVTEDMLYQAAVSAKLAHNDPSDHLHGNFTPFMKEDISNRAWVIFSERKSKKAS